MERAIKIQKESSAVDLKQNKGKDKIWCFDREQYQYVSSCTANCKKKDKCSAFSAYTEPRLF